MQRSFLPTEFMHGLLMAAGRRADDFWTEMMKLRMRRAASSGPSMMRAWSVVTVMIVSTLPATRRRIVSWGRTVKRKAAIIPLKTSGAGVCYAGAGRSRQYAALPRLLPLARGL